MHIPKTVSLKTAHKAVMVAVGVGVSLALIIFVLEKDHSIEHLIYTVLGVASPIILFVVGMLVSDKIQMKRMDDDIRRKQRRPDEGESH